MSRSINTIMYNSQHIKCGVITHSVKETRQQKEQWGWGREVTGKGVERVRQNLKKRGRQYRRGLHKIGWLGPL